MAQGHDAHLCGSGHKQVVFQGRHRGAQGRHKELHRPQGEQEHLHLRNLGTGQKLPDKVPFRPICQPKNYLQLQA